MVPAVKLHSVAASGLRNLLPRSRHLPGGSFNPSGGTFNPSQTKVPFAIRTHERRRGAPVPRNPNKIISGPVEREITARSRVRLFDFPPVPSPL